MASAGPLQRLTVCKDRQILAFISIGARHVPKVDLGEKQLCPNCGAKFYDLHKRPAHCPKCGNTFDPDDETVKAKRAKARLTAFDPKLAEANSEDDEDMVAKVVDPDLDEDEIEIEEVTEELDAAAVDKAPMDLDIDGDDDADPINQGTGGADVPEGFSEQELDEDDPTAEDDEVPFLEDDEDIIEDELGDLPEPDDESDPR
jgi:uncharacterized protein (TIGR02300 family)